MNKSAEELEPGVVACEICLKEIPRSVGQSEEAVDYVYYFCGPSCYERWKAGPEVHTIGVTVTGRALDFAAAQSVAEVLARSCGQAQVLASYDRAAGRESPQLPPAGDKPGWLAYAEERGGTLKVDVNHGEYIVMFAVA
jgi:YHS domain-containing protein